MPLVDASVSMLNPLEKSGEASACVDISACCRISKLFWYCGVHWNKCIFL